MSERIRWIRHKGKRILFVDYSELRVEEEYLKVIEELEAEYLKQPKEHQLLVLVDSTKSVATTATTARSKKMMATLKENGVPDNPTAIVGASGFQKAIVQARQIFVKSTLYMADSIEDAKEWLIQQTIE